MVLQAEGRPFGLVVDEINDTEEIVVKPLGKQLKGVNTFAGATIMGDGKVALILDVLGLAQKANVISELQDRAVAVKEASSGEKTAGNRQTLLLFQTGKNGRMAVPLSLVARLEEFASSKVENTGEQQVVQYRGQIMPLIRISEAVELPEGDRAKRPPMRKARCRSWSMPSRDAAWAWWSSASSTSWRGRGAVIAWPSAPGSWARPWFRSG